VSYSHGPSSSMFDQQHLHGLRRYGGQLLAGVPYVGAIVNMHPGSGGNRGEFIAWDPATGHEEWASKRSGQPGVVPFPR